MDKTVLFCTAPHPEKAGTLKELEEEMAALHKILAGASSKEDNIRRLKKNISEVAEAVREYPECFLGFGSVPLGMGPEETEEWIDAQITSNFLYGIGEFTPGNEQQIMQLDTVFQALMVTRIYPVWVHTFHPVTMDGIKLLMDLCEEYPDIPVIFGHLGGSNWMEVIKFAKGLTGPFSDSENRLESGESEGICLHGGLRLCRLAGAAAPISDEWRKTLGLIWDFPYCIYAFRSILYVFRSRYPKITENLPIN